MATGFTDPKQLNEMLMKDMSVVVNAVVDEIIKELKKKMDEIVYSNDPAWYPRQYSNGGLYELWEKSKGKGSKSSLSYEIKEHPENLTNEPDAFIHGSNYWESTDIRGMLAGLVIEGGSGPLFGEGFWRGPRDFWTPLIEMIENGEFEAIIERTFKSLGIIYIKM
jgi:hypothetical protein